MKQLLQQLSPDLPALIQVTDALSRNFSELDLRSGRSVSKLSGDFCCKVLDKRI